MKIEREHEKERYKQIVDIVRNAHKEAVIFVKKNLRNDPHLKVKSTSL